jgi:hypothetical protein
MLFLHILVSVMDITVLSDQKSDAFKQFFEEYGFSCQQVVPGLFGSPFCPPSRLLIIPSCFAIPKFYKILSQLEGSRGRIEEFAENGGTVLAYGAGVDGYRYDWLPLKPVYNRLFKDKEPFKKSEVRLAETSRPIGLAFEPGQRNCDAYFTGFEGEVTMALEDGRPVMVHKSVGRGHVIVSGIFDYPDKRFIERACSR